MGNDTIYGGLGNDTILGGSGNDILHGEAGDDSIIGGLGDNTISGGAGNDYISGGIGSDYVDYSAVVNYVDTEGIKVDLSITSQQDTKKAGLDTIIEIENIIGSNYDDTISGTNGDNIILAGSGNDTIATNGSSALGYDDIDGGSGDRDLLTYEYNIGTSRITVDLFNNSSVQDTGAGNIKIKNIEDVSGASGSDLLIGNESNNILKGNAGNDTLIGNGGDDTLYGGTGNDSLYGGTGNDLLEGGDDNDYLVGGLGNDTIRGGDGIDTVDYSLEIGRLRVILGANDTTANATIGNTDTDILSSIENVIGTQFGDQITGNNRANSIDGGAGDDTIDAGVDDEIDILYGNIGNDTFILRADNGVDIIDGGEGFDTVDYSSLNSTQHLTLALSTTQSTTATIIDGTSTYTDSIENIENIKSGAGNDILTGSDLNNTIFAEAGNDTIVGGKGDDYLDGGVGNDTVDYTYVTSGVGVNINLSLNTAFDMYLDIEKQVGNDQVFNIENVKGTAYNDSMVGDAQNNLLEGNAGNDYIDGGVGDDTLRGGTGNDTLRGGVGNDILDGGDGIDIVDYSNVENEDLIIDLNSQGEKTVSISQGKDIFISIEGAIGSQGNDILIGTSSANTLIGGFGNDTILANGASSGTDYVDGGANDNGVGDLVSFAYTNKNIKADLSFNTGANENVVQISGDGNIIIKNIENLKGGFGNDILIGNNDINTIYGGTGNDTLVGKGSNDYLDGGVDEYSHKFTINGTPTSGTTYRFQIGTILISFLATSANASDILNGILSAFEVNNDARKVADLIRVGDELQLYTALDITNLNGLTDTFVEYKDTADYSSSNKIIVDMNAETDTATIEKGEVSHEDGSKDTLVSIENIIGSNYNDTIFGDIDDNIANMFDGGEGDDTIYGGSGNDTIYGGSGNDLLRGDAGDDTIDTVKADIFEKTDLSLLKSKNDIFNQSENIEDTNILNPITLDDIFQTEAQKKERVKKVKDESVEDENIEASDVKKDELFDINKQVNKFKEDLENIINMKPQIDVTDPTKIILDSETLKENSEFDLKSKEKN